MELSSCKAVTSVATLAWSEPDDCDDEEEGALLLHVT